MSLKARANPLTCSIQNVDTVTHDNRRMTDALSGTSAQIQGEATVKMMASPTEPVSPHPVARRCNSKRSVVWVASTLKRTNAWYAPNPMNGTAVATNPMA